jgi:xanthine dehydrogenase YagS FAD-binding subunit
LNDFYFVPGSTPNRENVLQPGELITHVTLPALPAGTRSYYLKRRDRASYEFALASAAVVVQMQDRTVRHIRVALGGVGTKPWRSKEAELALEGREASESNFHAAAEAALQGAKPLHDNAFKIELAKRTLTRALKVVTQGPDRLG